MKSEIGTSYNLSFLKCMKSQCENLIGGDEAAELGNNFLPKIFRG